MYTLHHDVIQSNQQLQRSRGHDYNTICLAAPGKQFWRHGVCTAQRTD